MWRRAVNKMAYNKVASLRERQYADGYGRDVRGYTRHYGQREELHDDVRGVEYGGRSDISVDSIEKDPERTWLEQLRARGSRVVQVTYPRTANNPKELTVNRGEFLEVLDDSRKWWKVQNMQGRVGHVPNTIVTLYTFPNDGPLVDDRSRDQVDPEEAFPNPLYSPEGYYPQMNPKSVLKTGKTPGRVYDWDDD
ncbi:unnamed protein product [Notodromas monacha]|uniref:SH3 domain-containing protein n=1 Tax=Notodromas monacha TaxID=399045 RepID=A0A7R9BMR6_9CRUS|nr:unnamed protein product [Notodromas monacha]CAG0918372.1 unnamed protein product [Notodromas monacha]